MAHQKVQHNYLEYINIGLEKNNEYGYLIKSTKIVNWIYIIRNNIHIFIPLSSFTPSPSEHVIWNIIYCVSRTRPIPKESLLITKYKSPAEGIPFNVLFILFLDFPLVEKSFNRHTKVNKLQHMKEKYRELITINVLNFIIRTYKKILELCYKKRIAKFFFLNYVVCSKIKRRTKNMSCLKRKEVLEFPRQ